MTIIIHLIFTRITTIERYLLIFRKVRGAFPSKQLKYVLAWGDIHQEELMENWELAKQDLPLKKIAPLM